MANTMSTPSRFTVESFVPTFGFTSAKVRQTTDNKSTISFKIDLKNIFTQNRLGLNDSVEGGQSLTLGGEYKITDKKNNSILTAGLASVLRDKNESKLPTSSTINNESSDIVGSFNFIPNDNFSFDYNFSVDNDFSSTIDETDQETVKATITWPIIKGGENISSIRKSSYNKQRYQLIFQDTKNKINTEISNAWSKYQSSKSVLEATKAQLKAAEIANEGITLEYDSGNTRTTLELIQSRSLLLDARIAFARSERDFMVSQFELAKQLGSLSIKSIK